jgi:hypothetical protein
MEVKRVWTPEVDLASSGSFGFAQEDRFVASEGDGSSVDQAGCGGGGALEGGVFGGLAGGDVGGFGDVGGGAGGEVVGADGVADLVAGNVDGAGWFEDYDAGVGLDEELRMGGWLGRPGGEGGKLEAGVARRVGQGG